ncbi:hypothetical protein VCHA39O220_100201 [Vibrio chagasii]|nr:hypothetical protein VCHA39O220_100201 [Vibrio chagasii]
MFLMSGNLASNSEIEIMLVGMFFWAEGRLNRREFSNKG